MDLDRALELVKQLLTLELESGEGLTEAKLCLDKSGEWDIILDSREINRAIMDAISAFLDDTLGYQFEEYNELRIYTYVLEEVAE